MLIHKDRAGKLVGTLREHGVEARIVEAGTGPWVQLEVYYSPGMTFQQMKTLVAAVEAAQLEYKDGSINFELRASDVKDDDLNEHFFASTSLDPFVQVILS